MAAHGTIYFPGLKRARNASEATGCMRSGFIMAIVVISDVVLAVPLIGMAVLLLQPEGLLP
jgi:hypothetical protein